MLNLRAIFAANKENRREARYEKNKRKMIAVYARKYGVRPPLDYEFKIGTPEDRYLSSLKEELISHRITMLGSHKIDTLRYCAEECLRQGVVGDFIETGVWRGGACIFMAGVLHAYGNTGKKVLVADSFAGLPPPDVDKWPADEGDTHYTRDELAVGLDEVKANFARFDLLADNIVFIEGFFEDSLQTAPIDKLSILRLDGDMYGSTMTALDQLYDKLEIGGYLILDDWLLKGAQQALLDFRARRGIKEPLLQDFSGVFWQKLT